MSDIFNRHARALRWARYRSSIGGCLAALAVVAFGIGASAAVIFGVVRIVRIAWGSP